ncbi:MAG: hypothetical protein HY815_32645, partial [Candidatus Riflebacteria bacterium]|nr:hypothetical protein [Candidatus Riflebacteria bacterium]
MPVQPAPLLPGESSRPRVDTYVGLALTSGGTILAELVLTRLFSVSMWFHLAFVGITVALLGLGAGGVAAQIVSRRRLYTPDGNAPSVAAVLAAISLAAGLVVHLVLPFKGTAAAADVGTLCFHLSLFALGFACVGFSMALVLTGHPHRIGGLYGTDLVGAATGGLAFFPMLWMLDGPAALLAAAGLWALGGACYGGSGRARLVAVSVALLMGFGIIAQSTYSPLKLRYQRGFKLLDENIVWEGWDPLGYVSVSRDIIAPWGWGLSSTYPGGPASEHYFLEIDRTAVSQISGVPRNPAEVSVFTHDITQLVYLARQGGRAFVVGVGGGRDLRAARLMGASHVTGVEINGTILYLIEHLFREFNGRLTSSPWVTIVHDEARSWLRRSDQRFDTVQISLVDTC